MLEVRKRCISRNHGGPGDDISLGHFVEQELCIGEQLEFHVHIEKIVEEECFGLVATGEDVIMKSSAMLDSTVRHAALDELGVSDGVGENIMLLHRV